MSESRASPCRACGKEVSEYAAACPNCGDPTAARYGHAPAAKRAFGLGKVILLAFVAFSVYAIATSDGAMEDKSRVDAAEPLVANPPRLKIEELRCYSTPGGMAVAEGYATNAGGTELRYTEIKVRLLDGAGGHIAFADGHLDVAPLVPGAKSSFKLLGPSTAFVSCKPESATSAGSALVLSE